MADTWTTLAIVLDRMARGADDPVELLRARVDALHRRAPPV
jgi:hypothetical protein